MRLARLLATLGFVWTFWSSSLNGVAAELWVEDIHTKVLRDARPSDHAPRECHLEAARNEYESAQLVVKSPTPVKEVTVKVSELLHENEKDRISEDHIRVRFIGYIHLDKNTPDSELVRVATAPCDVPDPLLEDSTIALAADQAQPVWITVFVPKDAKPGTYRGTVTVSLDGEETKLPITLKVFSFVLPAERHLFVTNWFNLGNIARAHRVELYSDAFWLILERYARNMAEHRQNVVLTPWSLIESARQQDGSLSFDYSRFDRFVETFLRAGVSDGIEISHLGYPEGGWGGRVVLSKLRAKDVKTGSSVTLGYSEGLKPFLENLEHHLEEKGWLSKAMIHVSDEPAIMNVDSWREASALVRQAAPRIRRIDAIETTDFEGCLEIWVPKLSQYDAWRETFEKHRNSAELWYYICCHPFGNVYPNRFLDFPGTSVRVLHWINYRYDLKGYLHWGWNFWGENPFGVPRENLPPGDTHIVYPGRDGPLDSVRWEIQRESLEDFEYLYLLQNKIEQIRKHFGAAAQAIDPRQRPLELARRVVPDLVSVTRESSLIWQTRHLIAEEIEALDRPPVGLLMTQPSEGTILIHGPINLEIRGVVETGTEVLVNGNPVSVRPDGWFGCRAVPRGENGEVRVEFRKDHHTKTMTRYFTIRRS
ncbi:glycoside hydrolase domain-containing protein [Thermogutta sp.]|uniref:DUF4091 domain-containing protein n=1 Tax=Thermogutta sp. TaxID=1962930 RepID=UPI0032209129